MLLLLQKCEPAGPRDFNHGCGKLDNLDLAGSHVYLLEPDQSHLPPSPVLNVAMACVPDVARTIVPGCDAKLPSHNLGW